MITEGIWQVTTGEAVYVLDLTAATVTRLPGALGKPEHGVPVVIEPTAFATNPVSPPVEVEVGEPLPESLGYPHDRTPVVAVKPVPF